MKFFFGLLAFIAATVVVVLLVISLFRSFGSDTTDFPVSQSYSFENEKAIDTIARYRVVGPVVADENHREVRITVSKSARTIEVIKGYKGTVEKSATYENNAEAYKAFLGALKAAQFSQKRDGVTGDPSSTCVTGNKYYYELASGSTKSVDTWTTSCSFAHGTFAGNNEGTAQLFRNQIPQYTELTAGANLYSL